jgi:hypothetical protein
VDLVHLRDPTPQNAAEFHASLHEISGRIPRDGDGHYALHQLPTPGESLQAIVAVDEALNGLVGAVRSLDIMTAGELVTDGFDQNHAIAHAASIAGMFHGKNPEVFIPQGEWDPRLVVASFESLGLMLADLQASVTSVRSRLKAQRGVKREKHDVHLAYAAGLLGALFEGTAEPVGLPGGDPEGAKAMEAEMCADFVHAALVAMAVPDVSEAEVRRWLEQWTAQGQGAAADRLDEVSRDVLVARTWLLGVLQRFADPLADEPGDPADPAQGGD